MESIKISVTLDMVVPLLEGKYLITNSNFTSTNAYIYGVPLKVLSNPYPKKDNRFGRDEYKLYIKVVSLITGIHYEIPYNLDWMTVYDDFESLLLKSTKWIVNGYSIDPDAGSPIQLINKPYYPMDNSYASRVDGGKTKYLWVADKECTLLSVPFDVESNWDGDVMKKCILVKVNEDNSVGRAMFMEWKLLP